MPKYEATFHARHGGSQTETFEAKDSKEAAAKARRYRASFGVGSASSFPKITIRKVSE